MNEKPREPHQEGREAFFDDQPLAACPYHGDDIEAAEWEGGWMEAEEEQR